jgi:hypothetical protein
MSDEKIVLRFPDDVRVFGKKLCEYKFIKFGKEKRSGFRYWYYHWKAFNLTALALNQWKFKYIFHDFEKPWLKLLWGDYMKVQKFHREHNPHHWTYKNAPNYDYEAMAIDWECSRFTKLAAQKNAREHSEEEISKHPEREKYIVKGIYPVLERFGL